MNYSPISRQSPPNPNGYSHISTVADTSHYKSSTDIVYPERLLVFRPENLHWNNILWVLEDAGIQPEVDNFKYLINLLVEQHTGDRTQWDSEDDFPYIPLMATFLQKVIWNYDEHIRYLIDEKIIERTLDYKPTIRSYGYRLAEEYRTALETDYITNATVIKNIIKFENGSREEISSVKPELEQWFNGLQVDQPKANAILERLQEEETARCTTKEEEIRLSLKYAGHTLRIHRLASNRPKFSMDKVGPRFYSPLTNLKKQLRNALSFEGQRLVCLDLKNSQPFLSTVLFNPEFYQPTSFGPERKVKLGHLSQGTQHKVNKVKHKVLQIIKVANNTGAEASSPAHHYKQGENDKQQVATQLQKAYYFPMIGYNEKGENCNFEEVQKADDIARQYPDYIQWVTTGNFYLNFGKEYISRIEKSSFKSEEDLKKQIKRFCFVVFFSKNQSRGVHFTEPKKCFQSVFPKEYRIFEALKGQNHVTLAWLLQSIEAEIFLNRIVGRITLERPAIPLFTIHDSIATTTINETYVTRIMQEELQSATGLMPSIAREEWW